MPSVPHFLRVTVLFCQCPVVGCYLGRQCPGIWSTSQTVRVSAVDSDDSLDDETPGLTYFGMEDKRQGIVHVIGPEQARGAG